MTNKVKTANQLDLERDHLDSQGVRMVAAPRPVWIPSPLWIQRKTAINSNRCAIFGCLSPYVRLLLIAALFGVFAPVVFGLHSSGAVYALEKPGEELKEVGLTTVNGTELDLALEFVDEDGRSAPLSQFLSSEKPNILIPAYYDCPRLCGLLLTGVTELLNKLTLTLGDDYRVVTVSFNPQDTPESARRVATEFRGKLLSEVSREGNQEWKFLSGNEENIVPLMKSLGFHFKEDKGEFAHVAAIFLLSPKGMISQHFAGISFPYRDVRLALVEASQGKIGTLLDHALLFCYRFDDLQGKYTWAAFGLVRTGAGMTLIALVLFIGLLRRQGRLRGEELKESHGSDARK